MSVCWCSASTRHDSYKDMTPSSYSVSTREHLYASLSPSDELWPVGHKGCHPQQSLLGDRYVSVCPPPLVGGTSIAALHYNHSVLDGTCSTQKRFEVIHQAFLMSEKDKTKKILLLHSTNIQLQWLTVRRLCVCLVILVCVSRISKRDPKALPPRC